MAFETCHCDKGWNDTSCDTPDCSSRGDCQGQGICLTPDTCECFDGYEGLDCGITSQPNVNPPVFNETEYNVTIYETTKAGTLLVKVSGYDIDYGRNGELRYSIDRTDVEIDLPRYLMLDSLSGQVTLIDSIPRSVVPSGTLSIFLVLSDRGSPSLTDMAVLNIHVIDVNNHCPVFSYPSPGEVILVNASVSSNTSLVSVHAQDDDFGENGRVKYTLKTDTHLFKLDMYLGFIYLVTEPLPVGKYTLTIEAADHGETSCVSETTVVIQVYPATLETETLKRVSPPVTEISSTKDIGTTRTGDGLVVTSAVSSVTTTPAPSTTSEAFTTRDTVLEETSTRESPASSTAAPFVSSSFTATPASSITSAASSTRDTFSEHTRTSDRSVSTTAVPVVTTTSTDTSASATNSEAFSFTTTNTLLGLTRSGGSQFSSTGTHSTTGSTSSSQSSTATKALSSDKTAATTTSTKMANERDSTNNELTETSTQDRTTAKETPTLTASKSVDYTTDTTEEMSNLPLVITGSVFSAIFLIAFVLILALCVSLRNMKIQAAKKGGNRLIQSVHKPKIADRYNAYSRYFR